MSAISAAWESYSKCRKQLWWPLSFLFLAPLATAIILGVIIPLGFESIGLINFNYRALNFIYLLLAGIVVYFTFFPLLDGLYRLIFSYLDGEEIDENSGFNNFNHSANTGIGLFIVLLFISLISVIGTFIKFLKLPLLLIIYPCIVFTPLLTITDGVNPLLAWRESFKIAIENWQLTLKIYAVRVVTLITLITPLAFMHWASKQHPGVYLISLLLGLSLLIFNIIKLLPFYFFYPAYAYKNRM